MSLPLDHASRMERTLLALDGLSIGDAFGERFFGDPDRIARCIENRIVPKAPWETTDDTAMALGVVEVIRDCGTIVQDKLAGVFARRYAADPNRGYGGGAHGILQDIGRGVPWRVTAGSVFGGSGSMGNGGAMRVAPLGAYFADDLDEVVRQARASAEVTHAHPDGQAGAIAIAIAAAVAWRMGTGRQTRSGDDLLNAVFQYTPDGPTKTVLELARRMQLINDPRTAASVLGAGYRVISMDTVPFCVWCAARHLDDYESALWTTVSGLGDRDTTCAIVGGIVALSAGRNSIPPAWLEAREPLALDA